MKKENKFFNCNNISQNYYIFDHTNAAAKPASLKNHLWPQAFKWQSTSTELFAPFIICNDGHLES